MDMNIDKSGRYDEAFGVEGLIGLATQLSGGSNFREATVFEKKIVFALKVGRGVDEVAVADCETGVFQSKTYFAADLRR
jgi:hypothetical protein